MTGEFVRQSLIIQSQSAPHPRSNISQSPPVVKQAHPLHPCLLHLHAAPRRVRSFAPFPCPNRAPPTQRKSPKRKRRDNHSRVGWALSPCCHPRDLPQPSPNDPQKARSASAGIITGNTNPRHITPNHQPQALKGRHNNSRGREPPETRPPRFSLAPKGRHKHRPTRNTPLTPPPPPRRISEDGAVSYCIIFAETYRRLMMNILAMIIGGFIANAINASETIAPGVRRAYRFFRRNHNPTGSTVC